VISAPSTLCLTGADHAALKRHLFPGDGLEAAAILFCRDAGLARERLMVVRYHLVTYAECAVRSPDRLTWPGQRLAEAIDVAESEGLSLILLHAHPGGFWGFSGIDDASDAETMSAIFGGWSGPSPRAGHGSAIMTPDGAIRARLYEAGGTQRPLALTTVAGDDLSFWWDETEPRSIMAFGEDMTRQLARLHAAVIGVSGTGSIMAEQAARMGFGALTLIDFDRVELKNLNRILNSTLADAESSTLKVETLVRAIATYRPNTAVRPIPDSIASRAAVLAAAEADVLFCCVDSAEGRQIADLIAQAFLLPLIDMGVTIPTRRTACGGLAIADVLGRVDYVQPGGATLLDRGVYSAAALRAEYLRRVAPDRYAEELDAGYIKGAPAEAASVIALNMRAASAAMLEFLARAFPFRHGPNSAYARSRFTLVDDDDELIDESDLPRSGAAPVGTGAAAPLLGLPALED
jgi:ThiF family/Prokaryotic homologs of the JAB domain